MIESVRRELILSNALDIVREGGFAALNLPAVAVRCDCGLTTIKRHFKTNEALCRAVVDHAQVVGDEEIVKTGRRLFPVDI
jgi:AcrR family transcriptional regulator